MNKKSKRINVYMTESVYNDVENLSRELGVSMSSVMILAVHNFKQQNVVVPQLEKMLKYLEYERK